MLLDVTDPSSRHVLTAPPADTDQAETAQVDAIGVVAAARMTNGQWVSWPATGTSGDVARFTWPTWNVPRWRARRRAVFFALRDVFRTLALGGAQ
jgi:hypothetical protein